MDEGNGQVKSACPKHERMMAHQAPKLITRHEIRKGDTILFSQPSRSRRRYRVMVHVTHTRAADLGLISGYRARLEGNALITRGEYPLSYFVPEAVELVRR